MCGGVIRQLLDPAHTHHNHFNPSTRKQLLKAYAQGQKTLALLGEARNEYDIACEKHHNEYDYVCKQKMACALSYNFALSQPDVFDLVRCPYGDWKRHDDEDDEDYFERLGINEHEHEQSQPGPSFRLGSSEGDQAEKLYQWQRNGGPNGLYDQSAHGQFWDQSDIEDAQDDDDSSDDDDDDDDRKRHARSHIERSPSNTDWLNGDDWESQAHSRKHDAHYYHIAMPNGLHADSSDLQTWRSRRHGDHNRHHGDGNHAHDGGDK